MDIKDERVFATGKMNKPMSATGEIIPFKLKEVKEIIHKDDKPKNYRKLLFIFYIPLLIIDSFTTLLANIGELFANWIKELTLSLESYINNDRKPPESQT